MSWIDELSRCARTPLVSQHPVSYVVAPTSHLNLPTLAGSWRCKVACRLQLRRHLIDQWAYHTRGVRSKKTRDEAEENRHPRTIGRREETHRRIHTIVHAMPTEGYVCNSALSLYAQLQLFRKHTQSASSSILPSTPICAGEAGDHPGRRPRPQPAARQ